MDFTPFNHPLYRKQHLLRQYWNGKNITNVGEMLLAIYHLNVTKSYQTSFPTFHFSKVNNQQRSFNSLHNRQDA